MKCSQSVKEQDTENRQDASTPTRAPEKLGKLTANPPKARAFNSSPVVEEEPRPLTQLNQLNQHQSSSATDTKRAVLDGTQTSAERGRGGVPENQAAEVPEESVQDLESSLHKVALDEEDPKGQNHPDKE